MATTARFPFQADNTITKEFAKYNGLPNATRNKRNLVKQSNPFHYSFGNIRPVWKTWQTYAQNMQLLEVDYEDYQAIPKAEQA